MENKTKKKFIEKVRNDWHWLLFTFFCLICFSFLILQKGTWKYDDVSFWPNSWPDNLIILKQLLFSWDNASSTFFGFDRFAISFEKIISSPLTFFSNYLFGSQLGQLFFYISLLTLSYFFTLKLSRELEFSNYKVASLFFCFNPVSIFLLSQGTVFIAYCFIPASLYSLLRLLQNIKPKYILLNIISLAALATYLRILGLILLLITVLSIFYIDKLIESIKKIGYKKITLLFVLYLSVFSGMLSAFIFPFINHTTSQANYINYANSANSQYFYNSYRTANFLSLISLNQISANFGQFFIFINEIFTLVLMCILFYFTLITKKVTRLGLTIFGFLLFTFLIFWSAKFLTINSFIFIFSKILPFLSQSLLWCRIFLVICFVALIGLKKNTLVNLVTISFILIALTPVIFWFKDPELMKIKDINFSVSSQTLNAPAIFYPVNENIYNSIELENTPYPINPTYNPNYHYLFSNNSRLVEDNQVNLYSSLSNNPSDLFVFGLKDLFVFNNIAPYVNGQFDWYQKNNYQAVASKDKTILTAANFPIIETNTTYTHFQLPNSQNYDYLLYSPESMVIATSTDLIPQLKTTYTPLIILLSQISQLPSNTLIDIENALHQTSHLDVKYSYTDPTHYYLKIGDLNLNTPIIIQLNQSFSPDWKIYLSNSKLWNSKICTSSPTEYFLTKNSDCQYQYSVSDYFDLSFLNKNLKLIPVTHFSGNIIGNTFVIGTSTLSQEVNSDGTLYLVIYFEKQDYYVICFSIFTIILLTLTGITIYQTSIKSKKSKSDVELV